MSPGLKNQIMRDHDNVDKGANLFGAWYDYWHERFLKDWYDLGNAKSAVKKSSPADGSDLRKWTDMSMDDNSQEGNTFRFIVMCLWVFLGRAAEVMMLKWESFNYCNDSGGNRGVTMMERPKTHTLSELNTVANCMQLLSLALARMHILNTVYLTKRCTKTNQGL